MDFFQGSSGFIDYGVGVEIGGTHPQNYFSSWSIPSAGVTFSTASAYVFNNLPASASNPELTQWYWDVSQTPFTVPAFATDQPATLSYKLN